MNSNYFYEANFYNNNSHVHDSDEVFDAIIRRVYDKSVEEISTGIIYRISGFHNRYHIGGRYIGRSISSLRIYYCYVENIDSTGRIVVPINEGFAANWGFTEEMLFELANINTPRLFPSRFSTLESFIDKNMLDEEGVCDSGFYVLTNKELKYGASAMLYPKVMEQTADMIGGDYWIIPSSIHELIIVPFKSESELMYLRSTLASVNDSMDDRDEVLDYEMRLFRKDLNTVITMTNL